MIQSYLKRLEGLMVDDVSSSFSREELGGSQHVLRICDYTLNILNRFKLIGIDCLDQAQGLRIEMVQEMDDAVILVFQNSNRIVVDLTDDAYFGPEAMVLQGPDDLIVVWN